MRLAAGHRLGPYEVLAPLGRGGMGEVYRARDTRLDRAVALKLLPRALASDPQFRARFDREARVVSQLNHPHICVLHDVGRDNNTDYLVLELIDGESLAERIAKGPLPLDDALAIGIHLCEALDTAHRHGIVHRDLKPGNVMLARPGGSRDTPIQAKLLDFGLAKTALGRSNSNPVAAAQTITAALTAQGTMLGTFQYMAPEQVEGADADARSDVWAFGCMLYKMVSGTRPFTGKSPASLAGNILTAEPAPLTDMKPGLPPALDRIVRKCLAKDPDARWQSARDLGDELKWMGEGGAIASAARARQPRLVVHAAWGLALTLAIGAAAWLALRPQEPRALVRLSVAVPIDAPLQSGANQLIAISPDGQRIVYGAMLGDRRQLFLRTIDQFEPAPIRGTDDGTSPAFSPDGESVAFIADGKLKRVQSSGTSATVSLVEMTASRGLSWSDDGFIYLPLGIATGISRINISGGAITAVTELDADARSHRWPHVLPGGRTLLYVAQRHDTVTFDQTEIVARRLDTHEEKTIIRGGTDPRFVAPGHIVFGRGGVLMAVPFDERRLETVGEPVPVIEGVVMHDTTGAGQYAVASNGTLVYAHGSAISTRTLVWVDREGRETPAAPERNFNTIRLSPDGSRVAYVDRSGGNADIWVLPLKGGSPYRLTFGRELEDAPVWSADGIDIYYSSNKEGHTGIHRKRADGSGAEEKVYGPPQRNVFPHDISPDGRWLVLADGTRHLAVLSLTHEPAPRPLVTNAVSWLAGSARISPDGKWLAYQAFNDRGGSGIYVRPFPDGEGHWQVTAGERESRPVWSHDGREIYFRQGEQRLLAASVATTGSAFAVHGIRTVAQEPRHTPSYDATRDGRLLMLKDQTNWTGTTLNVILNWTRELRR